MSQAKLVPQISQLLQTPLNGKEIKLMEQMEQLIEVNFD